MEDNSVHSLGKCWEITSALLVPEISFQEFCLQKNGCFLDDHTICGQHDDSAIKKNYLKF